MPSYLLQDLVRVRELREDRASKALTKAQRVVEAAKQKLHQKLKELEEYREWRIQEEDRLIQSIMLKKVKLGEITDLRLEIAALREKELEHFDAVKKAEGELDRALEALELARKAHIRAIQELEKLLEHREAWQDEMKREAERLEELELEDFSMAPLAKRLSQA